MKVGPFWLVVQLQPSGTVLKRVAHVQPKVLISPFAKANIGILGYTWNNIGFFGQWADIG
jgi:hypothetical protein